MSNTTITSLAILKVNWDKFRKDYIENFVPFVSYIIKVSDEKSISIDSIQKSMEATFGLKIPQNSIKFILNRVAKYGYIKKEYGFYIPVREKLNNIEPLANRNEVIRKHNALIGKLINFCNAEFNVQVQHKS